MIGVKMGMALFTQTEKKDASFDANELLETKHEPPIPDTL
jgi:hypothetical protein